MNDELNEILEHLILAGVLEVSGLDSETGEFLYSFTPEGKETMPEIFDTHMNFVNSEIMFLWQEGFLDIDFFREDPAVFLTDKAFDENQIKLLEKQHQWSLEEIKRMIKEN